MEVGFIGLGTMGSNLALNIAEKGHSIAVFNRTVSRVDEFRAGAGQLAERIVPCRDLDELAQAIRPPRPVIIMVAAGTPVDEQIAALRRKLQPNDIVIDAVSCHLIKEIETVFGFAICVLKRIGSVQNNFE